VLVDLERIERGNKEKNILVILERKKAFILRCNIYKQYEHYSRNCQRDIVEQIGQLNSARSSGGVATIVIKPGLGIDPTKGPGLGFQGSTRVNSGQPGLTRKN
jgi:hypothetical protein